MFIRYLFYVVLTFLSVYGLIEVLLYLRDFIFDIKNLKNKKIYTLIPVKNEESDIENIIRATLLKLKKNDTGVTDNRVIIVDMDSSDKTRVIAEKMMIEYSELFVTGKEELLKDTKKIFDFKST